MKNGEVLPSRVTSLRFYPLLNETNLCNVPTQWKGWIIGHFLQFYL